MNRSLIIVLVGLVLFAWFGEVHADCFSCQKVQRVKVVKQVAAVQAVYPANVYNFYSVGAQLREQALYDQSLRQTYAGQLKRDLDRALDRAEAIKEELDRMELPPAPQHYPQQQNSCPNCQRTEQPQTPPQEPSPPFSMQAPESVTQKYCAKCHGEQPKKNDFSIDRATFPEKLAAVQKVYSGEMPLKGELTADEKWQFVREQLSDEEIDWIASQRNQ